MDAYDALVHDRVYRPATPEDKALAIMAEGQGKHFDAKMFERFVRMLPEFRYLRQQLAHEEE